MKKVLLSVLVIAAILSAAVVPVDRARKVAENYYKNYASPYDKGNAVTQVLTKEFEGQPTWYAFNFEKGFVIVSAEDAKMPILGHSFEKGTEIDSDLNNMNNPFNQIFNSWSKGVGNDRKAGKFAQMTAHKDWKMIETNDFPRATKAYHGPLLETHWHQSAPFSDDVPAGCPVGCVATAMSQVLRFHQGPLTGASSHSYTDNTGSTTGSHSVNFSTQTYDWSLMQGLYAYQFDAAESAEVAELCYALGVSVDMDYETDGSGAYTTDARNALVNYFSFDNSATLVGGLLGFNVAAETDYQSTLRTNIDNNRPVIWGGNDGTGGHCIVMDGYDDASNAYHWNYGWGGSGDGWMTLLVMEYNQSCNFIHSLFVDGNLAMMPAPVNFNAVNSNGDITLTWDAGSASPMGTIVGYEIYRNSELVYTINGTTETYVDRAVWPGTHVYAVRALYEDPDGHSLPSIEKSVTVTENSTYPAPIGFEATSYHLNRTKIDLAWTKPFVGTVVFSDDFETGNAQPNIPAGWNDYTATALQPSSWTEVTTGASTSSWIAIDGSVNPTWVHSGGFACYVNWNTLNYNFLITENQYALSGSKLTYWVRVHDDYTTKYHIILFSGALSAGPSGKITVVKSVSTDVDGANQYATMETVDLSAYTGNYHIGFVHQWNDGNSMAIDDIVVGSDPYPSGNQPTSYKIYNNGRLIDTVTRTGLTETYEVNSPDFDDGWNDFSVRAVYAAGESVGSEHSMAWMDANPQPYYLSGVWDVAGGNVVDLDWYAPGAYPPHWFGYNYEADDWYFVRLDHTSKLRTPYSAYDFGMTYPMILEGVAACFIDSTYSATGGASSEWTNDEFRIRVSTNAGVLYTSEVLHADPSGEYINYFFPDSLVVPQDWYVDLLITDSVAGYPNPGCFIHELGFPINSVFWYYTEAGWYYTYFTDEAENQYRIDWDMFCYGYNQEPTITKGAVITHSNEIDAKEAKSIRRLPVMDRGRDIVPIAKAGSINNRKLPSKDSKALQTYNVYRNGSSIGTTTNKYFTDSTPVMGDNTYYITATYTDPAGTSAPSNEVTLAPPPVMTLPALIATNAAPEGSSASSFNVGNTGLASLTYDMVFAYDNVPQIVTPPTNNFSTNMTGWTNSGQRNFALRVNTNNLDGTQYIYASGQSSSRTVILTSGTFNGTGMNNLKFEFDIVTTVGTSLSLPVQYSTNGGSSWTTLETITTAVGAWGSPVHKSYSIPSSANTIVRFNGTFQGSTSTISLDNMVITESAETWFTFNDATSGTVAASSSNVIDYTCSAVGLPVGVYTGSVTVTSNDPQNPTVVVPVEFTVSNTVTPDVPANLTTSIVSGNVYINWDDAANATSYDVYSSATPYGTFTLLTNVATSEYTYTGVASNAKMFFYVVSKNSTKASPRTIEIVRPASAK